MHLAQVDARGRLDGHGVEVKRDERHLLGVVARVQRVVHGLARLALRAGQLRANDALVRRSYALPVTAVRALASLTKLSAASRLPSSVAMRALTSSVSAHPSWSP